LRERASRRKPPVFLPNDEQWEENPAKTCMYNVYIHAAQYRPETEVRKVGDN
jgi:hypothetical protein